MFIFFTCKEKSVDEHYIEHRPGGGVLAVVYSQVSQRSNYLNQSIPPTSYHQPAHRLKVNNRTEQNHHFSSLISPQTHKD